jgi:hypothetical protein
MASLTMWCICVRAVLGLHFRRCWNLLGSSGEKQPDPLPLRPPPPVKVVLTCYMKTSPDIVEVKVKVQTDEDSIHSIPVGIYAVNLRKFPRLGTFAKCLRGWVEEDLERKNLGSTSQAKWIFGDTPVILHELGTDIVSDLLRSEPTAACAVTCVTSDGRWATVTIQDSSSVVEIRKEDTLAEFCVRVLACCPAEFRNTVGAWIFNGVSFPTVTEAIPLYEVLFDPAAAWTKRWKFTYDHKGREPAEIELLIRSDGKRRLVAFNAGRPHGSWTWTFDGAQAIRITFHHKGAINGRVHLEFLCVSGSVWRSKCGNIELILQ